MCIGLGPHYDFRHLCGCGVCHALLYVLVLSAHEHDFLQFPH